MATTEEIKIRLSAVDNASQAIRQTENGLRGLSTQVAKTNIASRNMTAGFATVGRTAGQASIQFSQLFGQIKGGTNPMLALSQQVADLGFVLGIPLVGAIVSIGSALLTNMNKPMEETKKTTQELIDELRKLEVEQGKLAISQSNLLNIRYNERVKELRSELALLKNQLSANSSQQFVAITQLEKLTEGTSEYDAQMKKINTLERQRAELLAQRTQKENELNDAVNQVTESSKDFVKELQKEVAQLGKSRIEILAMRAAKENLSAQDRKLTEDLIGQIQVYEMAQAQTKANKTELDKLAESTRVTSDDFENFAASGLKSMEDGLLDLITQTKSVSGAFRAMAASVAADLAKMLIRQSITQPLANAIGGFLGGSSAVSTVNGVPVENLMTRTSSVAALSTPVPMANGGPVRSGTNYLVGENGPEILTMGSENGYITPNGSTGGTTVVNFNLNAVDTQSGVQFLLANKNAIVGMVQQAYNRRGQRGPNG